MDTVRNTQRTENPSKTANCLSRFIFWYMNNTFSRGYARTLNQNDIFQINAEESSEVLYHELEREWTEEVNRRTIHGRDPQLLKVLFRKVVMHLLVSGILLLLHEALRLGQCLILSKLIEAATNDSLATDIKVYYWGVAFIVFLITQFILYYLAFYKGCFIGAKLRCALNGMLFRKALNIPEGSFKSIILDDFHNSIYDDANILLDGLISINFIWITPFILIVIIGLLLTHIGPSCLAGIGMVLLCIPIQFNIQNFLKSTRKGTQKKTERRVHFLMEAITYILSIKLRCLESYFETLISRLRADEIHLVKKSAVAYAFTFSLYGVCWSLFLLPTYTAYYLSGGAMNLSLVFFTLSLSIVLYQNIVIYFPASILTLREYNTFIQKLQKFLLRYDIESLKSTERKKGQRNEVSVKFQNVTASWFGKGTVPAIKNISFLANLSNSIVMIAGPAESGKSSILMAISNELNVYRGTIEVNGTVSYTAQKVWIFPGSIRQNILFGSRFNKERYEEVLFSCCLVDDVLSLKEKDFSSVDESNISSSNILKAKISIARTIYRSADIYLFDDVFSIFDPKVGKHIFERCIGNLLKNKVIIMINSQIQYLDYVMKILCLNDDGTGKFGSVLELSQSGVDVIELMCQNSTEKQWDRDSAIETDGSLTGEEGVETKSEILGGLSLIPMEADVDSTECYKTKNIDNTSDSDVEIEDVSHDSAPFLVYWNYISNFIGWLPSLILALFLVIVQGLLTLSDYWLAVWARGEQQKISNATITVKYYTENNRNLNLYLFIAIVVIVIVANILRTLFLLLTMIQSSNCLHNAMLKTVLKSPLNFFTTNSRHKFFTRFTNDIHLMDTHLPQTLCGNVQIFLFVLSVVTMNCVNIPYATFIFFLLMLLLYLVKHYYRSGMIAMKDLERISRCKVSSHVSAMLSGVTTIRSFGMQHEVFKEFCKFQDQHTRAWIMCLKAKTWIAQREAVIVVLFSIASIFTPVLAATYVYIDPLLTSICYIHIFTINSLFQWLSWKNEDVSHLMKSPERVLDFIKLEPEADDGEVCDLRETWPEIGLITGENASFAYDPSLPYVLRRLYFCIRSKEKIGVVGCSGAGKSSFILMLLRMAKVTGTIRIDGYSINELKLKTLRNAISTVPFDPFIFSGSLRENIDPYVKYTDADIWEALEMVQMKDMFINSPAKLDTMFGCHGFNFSINECRLLCLARALLEDRKILLIDGALDNLDRRTEKLMQRIMKEKFRESTVILVSYRLDTVMDLDRVLVMESGKIVEFDEPFALLQNSNGVFRKLVNQMGKNEASRLEVIADEAKRMRNFLLIQSQSPFVGSNITRSKTKGEILEHFGAKVIYETAL